MRVDMQAINHRIRNRSMGFNPSKISLMEARLYTDNGRFCENNAIDYLHNFESYSRDTNKAFDKALDIFEEICKNSNNSHIATECDFLLENVDKVRDSGALARSIKYRNSRLKSKIGSNITKNLSSVNNAILGSISNITTTLSKAGDMKAPTGVAQATKAPANNNANNNQQAQKEAFIEECYKKLYNKARLCKECDRIVENYNKISKRFNIDKCIKESSVDTYDSAYSVTEFIDTYSIPFKNKYNTALESVWYGLSKHFIDASPREIIEGVTDYFIFNGGLDDSEINDMKYVSENSIIFNEDDFSDIQFLFNVNQDDTSIDNIDPEEFVNNYGVYFESNPIENLKKNNKKKNKLSNNPAVAYAKEVIKGQPDEHKDDEIKKMVADFRKDCVKEKDPNKGVMLFKALVNKIFTKDPEQIVDEVPHVLTILRVSFVASTYAINPIIGILTTITSLALKLTLTRKQTEKMVKAYQKELDKTKEKIDKTEDKEKKDRLTKYRDALKQDYEKIHNYELNLYTDEENDERDAYSYDPDFDVSAAADDDDWNLDDDEWNLDESALSNAASIIIVSELLTSISEMTVDNNLDGIIYNNIFKMPDNAIDALTDFSITVPVILERDKLCEALQDYRNTLRKNSKGIENYIRIECLNENIDKLENCNRTYDTTNNMKGVIAYLSCLNELAKLEYDNSYVLEMNFVNTLKLAVDNLKRGAMKLSDKEKQISNSIDMSVSSVSKGLEQAMTSDNREAVIKGKILPSASKCIKLALGLGVSWAINPAIAVIGAIGWFACTKKLQAKERQLVLDDIEIELKMCDRYIKQAEDKDDLKKVRELEKVQRNLQRQQQRIKYKMHVIYKQDIKSPEEINDD